MASNAKMPSSSDNRKTIEFLSYASVFLIIPKWDLKNRQLCESKIRTIATVVINLLFVAMIVFSLYKRSEDLYPIYKNKLVVVLDIINECAGMVWFLITCIDTYAHKATWNRLLEQIDEMFKSTMYPNSLKENFWKTPLFQFCLFHVGYIIIIIMYFISWSNEAIAIHLMPYLVSRLILMYLEMLILLIIVNFVVLMKHEYQDLDEILRREEQLNIHFTFYVKKAKKLYCLMEKIVDNFNKLFGKHLFYIYFIVGIHYLTNFSKIAHVFFGTLYGMKFGVMITAVHVMRICFALVTNILFICLTFFILQSTVQGIKLRLSLLQRFF